MTPLATAPPGEAPVPSDDRSEFAAELHREDDEVLYPLLDRITEIAGVLEEGRRIDPDYMLEAIHLWGRYVNEIHVRRLAALARFVPKAGLASDASGHRRLHFRRHVRPRVETDIGAGAPPDTPEGHYGEIRQDQERMAQRLAVLESLIADYRRSQYLSRDLLTSLLRGSAFSDRAWARYEEAFVRETLEPAKGSDEGRRLEADRSASNVLRGELVKEVRRFLDRPIPVEPDATAS
jgi:hypothetical protein